MTFNDYNPAELETCRHELLRDFARADYATTAEWTREVLRWFRATARPDIQVYPPTEGLRLGEFMVDLCHTTYPLHVTGEGDLKWYGRAMEAPCRMKLALECEWGKPQAPEASLAMVLADACKLGVLRSAVKVMIFSSYGSDDPDKMSKELERIRLCHGDRDPWLWVDLRSDGVNRTGIFDG